MIQIGTLQYIGICITNKSPIGQLTCNGYMRGEYQGLGLGDRCDCGEGRMMRDRYTDCICEYCGAETTELFGLSCIICGTYTRSDWSQPP